MRSRPSPERDSVELQDHPIGADDGAHAVEVQSDAAADPYGIRLEVFEGPLDLLLYLIRKNEVDIYDIPVAVITAQYLSYLGQARMLDIERAGDFILMAATLMRIKSQMLLPRQVEAGEAEGEDPRQELVNRLLEYQQFKEIADWLGEQGLEYRDIFPSSVTAPPLDSAESVHPVSLFDLLSAYKHVLDHVPDAVIHRIVEEPVSVEECVELVLAELDRRSRLRFFGLVEGKSKQALVATFVGVLELLKSQRIRVQQARPFDEIWIESLPQPDRSVDIEVRNGGVGAAATGDDNTK